MLLDLDRYRTSNHGLLTDHMLITALYKPDILRLTESKVIGINKLS